MPHVPVPVPVPSDLLTILRADLRYFSRRPRRRHRLRLAAACEIEEARGKVKLILPPPGVRVFCAIQRTAPGGVHRAIGFAIDVGEVDFNEKTAAHAYALLNPQDVSASYNPAALWRAAPFSAGMRGPAE